MANFDIHQNKTRTFTLTPTKDGSPFPAGSTNPVFSSSTPSVFELSTGPAPFTINGKLLVVDNAFLIWSYQNANGDTINGSESITGLANTPAEAANGGTVEAGPEF